MSGSLEARERNILRQHLLQRCGRQADPSHGPVSMDTLLDLAAEAYYKNRPGAVPHERAGAGAVMSDLRPGDRVTWNDTGKALFGDTGSEGLLLEIREGFPGQAPGTLAGHVLWESGQDTWPSLSCLAPVVST